MLFSGCMVFCFVFVDAAKIRLWKKKKENKTWKLKFLQAVWPQPDEWKQIAKSYKENVQQNRYNTNNAKNACYWMLREVKPFSIEDTEKSIGEFEKMAEEFQGIWDNYDRCTNITSQEEYLNKWWNLFEDYRKKFVQWAHTNATKFHTQWHTRMMEMVEQCNKEYIKRLRETIDTKCRKYGKSIVINSIVGKSTCICVCLQC